MAVSGGSSEVPRLGELVGSNHFHDIHQNVEDRRIFGGRLIGHRVFRSFESHDPTDGPHLPIGPVRRMLAIHDLDTIPNSRGHVHIEACNKMPTVVHENDVHYQRPQRRRPPRVMARPIMKLRMG